MNLDIYYDFLYKFLYKRKRIMKIKIIALSVMSLCASQAFGGPVTYTIHNKTANKYCAVGYNTEVCADPGQDNHSVKEVALYCWNYVVFKRYYVNNNGVETNDGWTQDISVADCNDNGDMDFIINDFRDVTI